MGRIGHDLLHVRGCISMYPRCSPKVLVQSDSWFRICCSKDLRMAAKLAIFDHEAERVQQFSNFSYWI